MRLSSDRRAWMAVLLGCSSLLSGCSHMMERSVVSAFSASLNAGNLDKLKKLSSTDFEERTLEHEQGVESLKTLDLPEGKIEVIKVEEVDEDTKKVTVAVGKAKRRMMYQLVREPESRKWVVDELFLKSRDKGISRPLSDQVSLLLAVRDFISNWQTGEREAVLANCTPNLKQVLSEVPSTTLTQMTQRLVKDLKPDQTQPVATILDETARVRLPRMNGEVLVRFRRDGKKWQVEEVSAESRKEGDQIESVAQMARITRVVLAFEAAYRASDKTALGQLCTPRLYDGSLAVADLSTVPLPTEQGLGQELDIKLEGGVAQCVVRGGTEVMKVSLLRQPEENPDIIPEYRVDEIALYELNGNQDKRLSILFMGQALTSVFAEALLNRDLDTLRMSSSDEFNSRVWNRLDAARLRDLPLPGVHRGQPRIASMTFQGSITEITVEQGAGPVTYRLRDQSGKVQVDDVLTPALDRPQSLRTTLAVMIPIMDFANGFQDQKVQTAERQAGLDAIRGNSSREFCRVVWNQVHGLPTMEQPVGLHFERPLTKLNIQGETAEAMLGDEQFGARIKLIKERGEFVIDDVELISGVLPEQRVGLRRMLRTRLQNGWK